MYYSIWIEKTRREPEKITSIIKHRSLDKFWDFKKVFPEFLQIVKEQEKVPGLYFQIVMEKENKKGFFARYYFTIYSDGTIRKTCVAGGGIGAEFKIDHVGFEISLDKNLKLYNYRERKW